MLFRPQSWVITLGMRETADRAIADVLASLGGHARFNAISELEINQVAASGSANTEINSDSIVRGGLSLKSIDQPSSGVKLQYARNWSVQDIASLAETVSDADKTAYSSEHQSVTVSNSVPSYPHATDFIVSTLIAHQVDATPECTRRAERRAIKRETWEANCFISTQHIKKGDLVTVTHNRHGFNAGKTALIISVRKNYLKQRVRLELYV